MIKQFLKTGWILILLASCSGSGKQKPATKDSASVDTTHNSVQKNNITDPSIPGYYTIAGDSVVLPPFEIDLTLSDKAEQKLKNEKETVIVDAMLSGTPKDTTLPDYQESGEFSVGNKMIELSDSRTAKFEGIKIAKATFDSLADKDVQVLINVYSGRRASEDNILDVDFLQKPISEVKNGKFALHGKLIGE